MRRRFQGFLLIEVITALIVVGIGLGVLIELARQSARADAQALDRAVRELRLHGWLELVVAQPYPVLAGWAARGGEVPEASIPRAPGSESGAPEYAAHVHRLADGLLEVRVELTGSPLAAARLVSACDLSGEVTPDVVLP